MGFCSACGTEAVADDAFCSKCGKPLKTSEQPADPPAPATMTATAAPQAAGATQAAETTRLRVPATRLWEAVQKEIGSSWLGKRRVWYETQPADELVITDKRVVVLDKGAVLEQMEIDPGLLYEAQGASQQQWQNIVQIPFLGDAESKQHILRMRKYRRSIGGGCLLALFLYWFIFLAAAVALAIGGAAHSTLVGLIVFVAMFAALRVRPRQTLVLRPLHATPIAGSGLMSALIRHASGAGFGWEFEVEIPPERHAEVLALLQPIAQTMRQTAQAGVGYSQAP